MESGFDFYLSAQAGWVKMGKPILDNYVVGWVTHYTNLAWFHNGAGLGDDRPVIVDNGAWGRFNRKEYLPAAEVTKQVKKACEFCIENKHPIEMALLPDVVGDWDTTIQNAWGTEDRGTLPWALVIQDGFETKEVEQYLESYPEDRLFVGGSGAVFKKKAVAQLTSLADNIHVGRVTAKNDMIWAWNHPAVKSIDNSTFARFYMRTPYKMPRALKLLERLTYIKDQSKLTKWF